MLGWKKKLDSTPTDVEEARAARDAAEARLQELQQMQQQNAARRARIRTRKRQNGFGRELELVIRP